MEIRSLRGVDFDTVFGAFEQAFSDYEIRFEKEEIRSMLKRRGFNPELSFAAFQGKDIVAFTLNGIGVYDGMPTAYDTGTGTLKEYRGEGVAGEIFMYAMPYLKKAGIEQYLLEVLQSNSKAISVYRRLGFRVTREFDCFRQTKENINDFREDGEIAEMRVMSVGIEDISLASAFCDFCPSWQNSMESIERAGSDLISLGAYMAGELVAYCVFDPVTGDLSQMAVAREHRRKGIASRLFREMMGRTKSDIVKVLNVSADNRSLPAFLFNKGMEMIGGQFEMVLSL